MNKIQRKISLEPFKSRLPGVIPALIDPNVNQWGLSANGNWGYIVSDIRYNGTVMSYRTVMDRYNWIKNFYKTSLYYKDIKNCDGVNEWVGYTGEIIYTGTTFYSTLPSATASGRIVGLNSEVGTYNSYGGVNLYNFIEESLAKIKVPVNIEGRLVPDHIYGIEISQWYNWMNTNSGNTDCCVQELYKAKGGNNMLTFLRNNLNFVNSKISTYRSYATNNAYAMVSIALDTSFDAMGEYTNAIEEWVPGKVYYLGDVVLYNGESYVLETAGADKSYSGYFDEKYLELFFDDVEIVTVTVDGVTTVKIELILNHWKSNTPVEPLVPITTTAESQLSAVRRLKESYDDDGNKLPGVLIPGNTNLEMEYLVGVPYNIKEGVDENGNAFSYGDILTSTATTVNNGVSFIKFTYYIGAKLNNDGSYNSGGLRFEEEYPYVMGSYHATVDGQSREFSYMNIDYNTLTEFVSNPDLDDISRKALISTVNYQGNWLYNENDDGTKNVMTSPVFREDYKMGITTKPIVDTSTIYIDRGRNGDCFEQHIKLQEVRTLFGMEQYSNGSFFKMITN
jgi:hypothetical protein